MNELKHCPLCGGEAVLEYLSQSNEHCNATIRCQSCGLTLEWATEYKVGINPNGSRVPLRVGLDPIEAWNRRAEVENDD